MCFSGFVRALFVEACWVVRLGVVMCLIEVNQLLTFNCDLRGSCFT